MSPVIEFSSAGLRKPVDDTYPSGHLLDQLLEAGLDVTTASDAHVVDQIGANFDVLATQLDARGVTELVSFRRRNPVRYGREPLAGR